MKPFFLFLLLSVPLFVGGEEIRSLEEVLPFAKNGNTLVIFRLEGVLTSNKEPSALLSEKTLQVINELQKHNIPLIAITAHPTGKKEGIESLEGKKIQDLRALGLDFTKTSPASAPIVFSELSSNQGFYPTYFSGILFSNGDKVPSGLLVLSFFNRAKMRPDAIVYVDDSQEHLNHLESYLKYLGKPVEYRGLLLVH